MLINATLGFAAESAEAENAVVALREDVKTADPGALVGGARRTDPVVGAGVRSEAETEGAGVR